MKIKLIDYKLQPAYEGASSSIYLSLVLAISQYSSLPLNAMAQRKNNCLS